MKPPVDYRSVVGIMLRGNNVYNGGSRAPNPTGRNQWTNAAKVAIARRKKMMKRGK